MTFIRRGRKQAFKSSISGDTEDHVTLFYLPEPVNFALFLSLCKLFWVSKCFSVIHQITYRPICLLTPENKNGFHLQNEVWPSNFLWLLQAQHGLPTHGVAHPAGPHTTQGSLVRQSPQGLGSRQLSALLQTLLLWALLSGQPCLQLWPWTSPSVVQTSRKKKVHSCGWIVPPCFPVTAWPGGSSFCGKTRCCICWVVAADGRAVMWGAAPLPAFPSAVLSKKATLLMAANSCRRGSPQSAPCCQLWLSEISFWLLKHSWRTSSSFLIFLPSKVLSWIVVLFFTHGCDAIQWYLARSCVSARNKGLL